MGWVKIAENPQTGVSTWIAPDPDDPEGVIVQSRQNVSTLLDKNAAERNLARPGWGGDWHKVASLPSSMMYDRGNYIADAVAADDHNAVRKFLNDSDNQKLRTKEGNL